MIEVKDVYCPPETAKKAAPPEVMIKRRQGGPTGQVGGDSNNGSVQANSSENNRSVKQREEEYKEARDRILGDEYHTDGTEQHAAEDAEDEGKGRKAVFRDRVKELQDPDYRRGSANRYQQSHYEPQYNDGTPYGEGTKISTTAAAYTAPTYNSEFPALPGATGPVQPPPPYPHTGQQRVFLAPEQQMVGKQGYATQLNFTMPNSVMHPGLGAVQFPPPVGAYGFPPGARPGFRVVTAPMVAGPTGSTQGMISVWNQQAGFPALQVTAAPTTAASVVRPPQSFGMYAGGYPSYPNYAAPYLPGAVRSPYIAVAQGNNHLQHSTAVDPSVTAHMHQMTTIRRKPVGGAQHEGSAQTDR